MKILLSLLIISLLGTVIGIGTFVVMFSNLASPADPKSLSLILIPVSIGYCISMIATLSCLLLALKRVQIKTTKAAFYLGEVLTWINAINAFPVGAIAALFLQLRVWNIAWHDVGK